MWDPAAVRPSIFDDPANGGLITHSLKPLDVSGGGSSGNGSVSADTTLSSEGNPVNVKFGIKVSNASAAMDATFKGELKLRKFFGVPYGVKRASGRLDLDPVIGADFEFAFTDTSAASDQGGALYKEFNTKSVPIPLGGPIPLTVRLSGRLVCNATVSATFSVSTRLSLRGHAAAGFKYNGGFDIETDSDPPSLTANNEFIGVTGKASLVGKCAVQGVIALLAFDAIGIQGAIGPYVSLEADVCANTGPVAGTTGGFALFEQHGLQADMGGKLQVPGLGTPSVEKDIFSFQPMQSAPHYFVGDEMTCTPAQKDSCKGRGNGLYCSQLADYSAYQCTAGTISGGQQCPSGQKCSGPNGSGNTIQCK